MKLSLDMKTSLSQTLTPQQIQYLKLLQLPLIQLEQRVQQEIEQNPMLESDEAADNMESRDEGAGLDSPTEEYASSFENKGEKEKEEKINEEKDPFEFYNLAWQDDSDYGLKGKAKSQDGEDSEGYQIKDNTSMIDDLIQQLRMYDLTEEEFYLGEQIIGNVDYDGYLRRDMQEIIDETNSHFAEINYEAQQALKKAKNGNGPVPDSQAENPARQYAVSEEALSIIRNKEGLRPLSDIGSQNDDVAPASSAGLRYLKPVTMKEAEKALAIIQKLDPPGIASRNIRECLLAQVYILQKPKAAQKLAKEILENAYDAFAMKHYSQIQKQLQVTEDYLKEAIDFIRTLNPKPGGGDFQPEINTVIPDFTIEKDEDGGGLLITVNDSRIPQLKLNETYAKVRKEAKQKKFNKETRDWIRNKYDDAKFLIQAIRQRRNTMLKVMTAIAHLQEGFFYRGSDGLRPLIYKDVAEKTGLDISTVCRIVNGKYVQTDYGTYELKYFFSESLPSEDGEEVSTTIIKNVIKDIIAAEDKKKPLSDDKIAKLLKDKGYNAARRTIAKYREQLKIPVARLRKEL